MSIPIVIVAYGTSSKASEIYGRLDRTFRDRFSGHDVYWAFSSQAALKAVQRQGGAGPQRISEVLEALEKDACPSAVVQSLHIICAGEFHRMVRELGCRSMRTFIGYPLLSVLKDYFKVAGALSELISRPKQEAVVLVGHGTKHPGWSAYPALEKILQKELGEGIFVGVLERGYPGRESVLEEIQRKGYTRVRLVPFLLVSGVHVLRDLTGGQDCWKTFFEGKNIEVIAETNGLADNPGIVDIFCAHIREALYAASTEQRLSS
jgi:sirohydrochlorin cobaltochelatase